MAKWSGVGKILKCPKCGTEVEPTSPAQIYYSKSCRKFSCSDKDMETIAIWQRNNPERSMLKSARHRAKRKGLPFNIELSDIVIPETCPILGIDIFRTTGHGGAENSPSLDRIDNSKGYVKGNVQVISLAANMMKSSATPEQLIVFANWILKEYSVER